MDALWIDIPEEVLEERHAAGKDKRDECWDGVIHMVPPASSHHEFVVRDLLFALDAIGKRRGCRASTAGLFEDATSWRIPDISVARPDQVSERGLEGADVVVEVLSPGDKSRDKFDFYARVGVPEVWLLHPRTRELEIYALEGLRYQRFDLEDGRVRSFVLGVELILDDGPLLRMVDGDRSYEV